MSEIIQAKKYMNQLEMDLGGPRSIIIEGPIGAGKTTLLNKFKKMFSDDKDCAFFGEYIEYSLGKLMLNKFISKQIKPDEFQRFILAYWKNTLKDMKKWNFIERGPIAGLGFCKESDFSTDWDYYKFRSDVHFVLTHFCLNNFKVIVVPYDISLTALICTICAPTNCGNLVIFLDLPIKTAMEHIQIRGREGEDKYSKEYITTTATSLFNLYRNYFISMNIEPESRISGTPSFLKE